MGDGIHNRATESMIYSLEWINYINGPNKKSVGPSLASTSGGNKKSKQIKIKSKRQKLKFLLIVVSFEVFLNKYDK